MIDGIDVIYTEVVSLSTPVTFVIVSVLLGALFFLLVKLWKSTNEIVELTEEKEPQKAKTFFLFMKISIVVLCVATIGCEWKVFNDVFLHPIIETHYTVTISDEVGYNKFTEKYDIITENDGVYIIKEKKDVN